MNEPLLVSIGLFHLKALALAVPLLAILYGIRRFSSQERYLALRIAFGILAAIPLLAWLAPGFLVPVVPILEWPISLPTSISVTATTLSASGLQPTHASVRFSIGGALAIGYGLITAVLLLRLIAQLHLTRKELTRYALVKATESNRLLDELQGTLGIHSVVELRISNDDADVYAWGIAKHVIVLPGRFADLPEQVRRTVLIHELIHVRRRDTALCLLVQMLCCLYWLNPAVWFLSRRLKLEMERSCDDAALSSGIVATDYADRLLQMATLSVASRSPPRHVVTMARATTLHRRIDSLLNEKLRRGLMHKRKLLALTTLLAAIGLGICACTVNRHAAPAAAANAKPEVVDVRLLLPDGGTNPPVNSEQVKALSDAARKAFRDAGFTERTFEIGRVAGSQAVIEIRGTAINTTHISGLMKTLDAGVGDPELDLVFARKGGSPDAVARGFIGLNEFKAHVNNLRFPGMAPSAPSRPQ